MKFREEYFEPENFHQRLIDREILAKPREKREKIAKISILLISINGILG